MAQKSKAASLTPDLLTSRNVPTQSAPRKQSTDLSLAPAPAAGQSAAAKQALPANEAAPAPAKAGTKSKAKEADPAPVPPKASDDAPSADTQTQASAAKAPSEAPAAKTQSQGASEPSPNGKPEAKTTPAKPKGGDGKAAVADGQPVAEADSDYRIRIPVPLDPSEHLELTLAAARSGRSCQEIIVEALFRYLEDIAGPPDGPSAPGQGGRG